ncbi:phage major capsid protein, HK97 family [Burkholderia pseudomallei MSHR5613]|uniref:phage major capsid protein n=1 Tax=Burkholderia pseudomallei TaxID=28450 RepID=UPI000530E38E|nr:phage major capsid protein [Burkholderia pseudomallei]KGS43339.1 phage major capsid protein, HK97 family [Burkholderia pseudomallei MSHR5613]
MGTPRVKRVSRGERNARWIEEHCRIPEGRLVGQPVKLTKEQRGWIKRIYDTPTRTFILSMARKNAKTALSAFLVLLHLVGPEAQPNSQLYSAAQSRDQAAVLFELAAKVVRMSENLSQYVTIRDTAKELLCHDLGTIYKALSADAATKFGLSPALTIHDELGQVKGPRSELYEALETASAAQESPLSIVISTQAPTDGDLLSLLIDDALNLMQAAEIAKQWKDSTPEVEIVLKAAVAAGTTTDPAWAGPLVQYQDMASEFIELLRPATIVGRIEGMRRVPFNVRVPGQTTGSSVGWVGEGKPAPVSALAFNTTTLGFSKVAGIVAITEELARFSTPSAEGVIQQDLISTISQFLDQQFIDPAVAAGANGLSPASITNGVKAIPASGKDAAAVRVDVKKVFQAYIAANLSVAGAVWIMSETTALSLSLMLNALGQPEFPGLTMAGGTFFGLPAILSQTVGDNIVLAKASEILFADDGGVTLDVSREASLQMDSAPVAGATELVSLWQNGFIAMKAERFINWKRRRVEGVQYISGAAYGDAAQAG